MLVPHRSWTCWSTQAIFTAGYKAVLHIHSLVEECEITQLIGKVDLKAKAQGKDSTVPVSLTPPPP